MQTVQLVSVFVGGVKAVALEEDSIGSVLENTYHIIIVLVCNNKKVIIY